MLASLIAERYAKALLRASQAELALDAVGAQAEGLSQALRKAEGAERFLADPLAQPGAKLAVMTAAFEGGPHAVLKSFLQAVIEHKREKFLPLILAEFLRLKDEAQGKAQASLGTARPLDARQVKVLEGALSERLGREVTLKPYTDKELLGGAVLRLGDTVYDASLRSRLKRLGQLLSEGPLPKAKAAASPKPKAKAASVKKAAAKKAAKPAAKKKAPAKKTAAPKAAKAVKAKPAKVKAAKAEATPKPKAKAGKSSAAQALAAKLLKKPS
jgi:F-type H+-transporting ATPase subunit delta